MIKDSKGGKALIQNHPKQTKMANRVIAIESLHHYSKHGDNELTML